MSDAPYTYDQILADAKAQPDFGGGDFTVHGECIVGDPIPKDFLPNVAYVYYGQVPVTPLKDFLAGKEDAVEYMDVIIAGFHSLEPGRRIILQGAHLKFHHFPDKPTKPLPCASFIVRRARYRPQSANDPFPISGHFTGIVEHDTKDVADPNNSNKKTNYVFTSLDYKPKNSVHFPRELPYKVLAFFPEKLAHSESHGDWLRAGLPLSISGPVTMEEIKEAGPNGAHQVVGIIESTFNVSPLPGSAASKRSGVAAALTDLPVPQRKIQKLH